MTHEYSLNSSLRRCVSRSVRTTMNTNIRSARHGPVSGPADRFWSREDNPVPFTQSIETDLERLKNRLLREAIGSCVKVIRHTFMRRAANEAAAIAWLEPYPLLVFPELFSEKANLAERNALQHESIAPRSKEFVMAQA